MTKKLTSIGLKFNTKLWSALTIISGLVSGQYPAKVLGSSDFDWLTETPDDGGIFGDVTKTVKDAGASAYQLVLAVGVIGLLFSIILVGISFVANKNATKKEENKSHLLWIAIGGIIIFGAMSILGLLQTMGSGLEF